MTIIPIKPDRVIQNVDRVVKASEFDDAQHLYVTGEPFLTIQGEGPLGGRVAWFVRLAGCNFGDKTTSEQSPGMCAFCDTSFQIDKANQITPMDLLARIVNDDKFKPEHILVITGGEPTLQKRQLAEFLRIAQPCFEVMQIETNGTQSAFFAYVDAQEGDDWKAMRDNTVVVISPKATEITGKYTPTSRTVMYSGFMQTAFKFLLSADDPCYREVPVWAREFQAHEYGSVYVSPIAVYKKPYQGEISSAWDHELIDADTTSRNYTYAAAYAIEHGLQLSIQQHLFCTIP